MNNITPFNYGDNLIRVVNDNTTGEPLWIVKDVCKVLQINNHRDALNRLDEDEKGVVSTDTLGGIQNMNVINESGLYSLILSSRKPEAKPFKRWVTHEVLPSIRKTGTYAINQNTGIDLTPLYTIMETQTRIMETMQMQSAITLSLIDSISKTQDDIIFGTRHIFGKVTTILEEVAPRFRYDGLPMMQNNPRISSEQRGILYSATTTRAAYLAEAFSIKTDVIASAIFAGLKSRFRYTHYTDIQEHEFDEAIEFVNTFEITR